MMLSDIAVKRPVFATVISLLLTVLGGLAFFTLPLRELPDIDPPIVSVSTSWAGASANVIEREITERIEDQLSSIDGIRAMNAQSSDGRSQVTIEFNSGRDIDAAANDVRDAISRLAGRLPDQADPPRISKADADAQPFMWLNLTSPDLDQMALTDYAERFVIDRFTGIEGVARVWAGGGQRPAMRVWLDPVALSARALTVNDVEDALRAENIELPAGRLEGADTTVGIRVERSYTSVEDFRNLVIAEGDDGHLIRLGEIARVEIAPEERRTVLRGNGDTQVGIGILRQSRSNILDISRAVYAEAERLEASLPDNIGIERSFDRAVFVAAAIEEVWRTLAIAGLVVIAVIALFLGSIRAALVPAVTVPVCLMASFIAFWAFGLSLNMLTLLALVLTIGLVVDDAIVMLENIQRRMDKGEPPNIAAWRGARQVGFAIIATTAVLVAVFLPLTIMQGTVGKLFRELGLTIAAAVAFSSLVALTLSPMMCARLLRPGRASRMARLVDGGFDRLKNAYRALVARMIHAPVTIAIMMIASFAGIAVIYGQLPSELAPQEDRGTMYVFLRGPEGASFDYMNERMKQVEARLIEKEVEGTGIVSRLIARVPASFGAVENFNVANLIVILKDWRERERSIFDVSESINAELRAFPGLLGIPILPSSLGGGGSSRPVQFVIGGSDWEELAAWRDAIIERAEASGLLVRLQSDYLETLPRLKVDIDRDRAADLGVSVRAIGRTLETLFGSRRVTTFSDRGEEYQVILQAIDEERRESGDVLNTFVRSERSGELIPLSNLITTRDVAEPGSLNRYNRIRAITLSANLAPGVTLGEALDYLEQVAAEEAPGASIDYKGESLELKENTRAIWAAFALALIVTFLVLAAQFESFIHPVTIMTTVPLAIFGALGGLWLAGASLNIYSQIGIIILIGIAAKNGILIVEFANQLREKGLELAEATVEAASTRLRPILMTSLSTAFGAVPLALASGAGAESRSVIGVTIVAGVLVATLFTLVVVPAFYYGLARFTRRPGRIAAEIAGYERDNPSVLDSGAPPQAQGTPAE